MSCSSWRWLKEQRCLLLGVLEMVHVVFENVSLLHECVIALAQVNLRKVALDIVSMLLLGSVG